ncbi:peptidase domain-containing ABC transporter [Solilutibacter silvestris]|uniref:peptidase domain-containing ABC transporter n=1 Tax=Solilutibacter silvestris TaxID=1645665 RepID=UPI003D337E08
MKPVLQSEAAECGLACLAMVLNHYDRNVEVADLRRTQSVSLKGMTLKDLLKIASDQGLSARPVRLELGELSQLSLPCILHWNLNHFVVLTRVTRTHLVVNDPAVGRKKISLREASEQFTGVAVELSPAASFEKQESKPTVSLKQLSGSIWGLRRGLFQILLLSLALQIFALVAPLLSQLVMDQVIVGRDYSLLTVVVIGFALLIVIQMGIGLARSWAGIVLSTQLGLQWNANVLRHVLKLPKDFFEKRHLGDITSRMGSVNTIQGMVTSSAVSVILDGLMAVTTLAVMLKYNSMLFLVSQAALAIYFVVRFASYRMFKEANEKQLVLSAKQNSYFLETLRGIGSIKVSGVEQDRHSTWLNLATQTQNQGIRISKMGMWYGTANGFIFGIEKLLIMYFGARLVMDNTFSIGMLTAFLAYNEQFSSRIASLIDTFIGFKMLRLHSERLADIVLTEPEAGYDLPEVPAPSHAGIEVSGLSYRYADGEPWVLKDFNLSIADGESVAIVGASGCGKTTLSKLLLGLLTPNQGTIRIGGLDLHKTGPRNLRTMMGVVMQDDQLFAGSIAENISLFDQEFDQERIEHAAKLAAIHEEIMAMPMGYHSLIGDMGSSLSGGQKQRILLARALYRKPRLLILDEATSHLDVARERLVNDAVKELKLTKVIIAHRPETIASADRVLEVEGGRAVRDFKPVITPQAEQPVVLQA